LIEEKRKKRLSHLFEDSEDDKGKDDDEEVKN
jgi:hypothetical protein